MENLNNENISYKDIANMVSIIDIGYFMENKDLGLLKLTFTFDKESRTVKCIGEGYSNE